MHYIAKFVSSVWFYSYALCKHVYALLIILNLGLLNDLMTIYTDGERE